MVNILIDKLKDKYGPIMNALINTGAKVYDGSTSPIIGDTIIFCNRPGVIPKSKVRDGKLGWWMCDLRNPYLLEPVPREIDAIFLCNKQYLSEYKEKYKTPTFYLPQCGLDEKIKPGREIKSEIVFIGGISSNEHHGNRWAILEVLRNKYEVELIFNEGTTPDQKWIYNKTPISLAISPQTYGYTSNRLYNILASSGFCLTLWFPGIEEIFKNHRHLVWFKDEAEAVELAGYYLKNKGKRDRIARAGHREYLKKHTARHRINQMLKYLYAI